MELYGDKKDDDKSSARARFRPLVPVQRQEAPKFEKKPEIPAIRPPLESLIYQRDQQEHAGREELKKASELEDLEKLDDDDEQDSSTAKKGVEHGSQLKHIEPLEEPKERSDVFARPTYEDPVFISAERKAEVGQELQDALTPESADSDETPHASQSMSPPAETGSPEDTAIPDAQETPHTLPWPTPHDMMRMRAVDADPVSTTPPPVEGPILRGPGPVPEGHGPDANEARYHYAQYGPPSVEYVAVSDPDAEYRARRDGVRLGLIGGFIAGWWLKRRYARKEMAGYQQETKKQFSQQQEQITYLTAEQQAAQDQLRRQREYMERMRLQAQEQRPEIVPLPPNPEKPLVERLWPSQEQAVPQVEQQIEVEAKQHVEHSAWHNIVVDEHGREVQGAITYGEAFNRELQREHAPQVQSQPTGSSAGLPVYQVGGGIGGPTQGTAAPGSPQELPLGHPRRFDSQNSTAYEPRGPIATALMNPWLWLMGIVLVIAFFIAAFI